MKQRDLFEDEPEQEERVKVKAPRQYRTLELITDFNKEGYADGWYFAVGAAFKDQLDIKFMERMMPVFDDNGEQVKVEAKDKEGNIKYKKDGTPQMKKKTRPELKWTQGKFYCFDEGHVIYDTSKAHLPLWEDALKHINLRCEVTRAMPNSLDDCGYFKNGFVTFTLSEPNEDHTGLQSKGQYHLTQNDFVEFLKTGKLKAGSGDLKA